MPEVQQIRLSEISFYDKNPRKINKDNFERLKKSLNRDPDFLNYRPILLYKANDELVVYAGNQRLKACRELGWETIPAIIDDKASLETIRQRVLLDNVEYGEWDSDILKTDWNLEEIQALDLPELDLVLDSLADIVEPNQQDDDVPEIDKEPFVKRGDIFEIETQGCRYRIGCLDSTAIDDIEKLMDGEKAGMVFTDPPYGMGLDTDYSKIRGSKNSIGFKGNKLGNKYKRVIGDNEDFSPDLIQTIFTNFDYCKEVFIWGADYFVDLLPNYGKDGSWSVWSKRSSEEQQKGIGSCFELCWSKNKHKRLVYNFEWFGFLSKDDPIEARNRVHPTMKPSDLVVKILNNYSSLKDNIVDLFAGSGSTAIACIKTQRSCFTCDIDEYYTQVATKRCIDYLENNNIDYTITLNGEDFDTEEKE
jgi:DNA modification methylase